MTKTAISLEQLLWRFQNERGLYVLGAGASAGIAPLGASFMAGPGLDYARNAGSFPVEISNQSLLTRRVTAAALKVLRQERLNRRFDLDDLAEEKLRRQSDAHAEFSMVNALARPRYENLVEGKRRQHCNYGIFNFFKPSLLMNYNLDGLATDVCGHHHEVVPVHGSVGLEFGSPEATALMPSIRDWGIGFDFDNLLLCVPEPDYGDPDFWGLHRRLDRMWNHLPEFVAVVGYSFASADQTGEEHDDHVSLDYFASRFRNSPLTVYAIAPNPDPLRERLEERLKSNNVVGVASYWNALTRAMRDRIVSGYCASLESSVGHLLDKHEQRAFLMSPGHG